MASKRSRSPEYSIRRGDKVEVRSPKYSFRRGDKVEVCDLGIKAGCSYYEATVVGYKGNDDYVVEYENIPLKETVPCSKVRPLPPEVAEVSEFEIGTRVDVDDQDAWRVGIISSKKHGELYTGPRGENAGGFQYVVNEFTRDKFAFPIRKLRFHRDWDGGEWTVPPPKKMRKRRHQVTEDDEIKKQPRLDQDVCHREATVPYKKRKRHDFD